MGWNSRRLSSACWPGCKAQAVGGSRSTTNSGTGCLPGSGIGESPSPSSSLNILKSVLSHPLPALTYVSSPACTHILILILCNLWHIFSNSHALPHVHLLHNYLVTQTSSLTLSCSPHHFHFLTQLYILSQPHTIIYTFTSSHALLHNYLLTCCPPSNSRQHMHVFFILISHPFSALTWSHFTQGFCTACRVAARWLPRVVILLQLQEAQAVQEEELPLTLPPTQDFKPSGRPESPLAKITEWVQTTDPSTGVLPIPPSSPTLPHAITHPDHACMLDLIWFPGPMVKALVPPPHPSFRELLPHDFLVECIHLQVLHSCLGL